MSIQHVSPNTINTISYNVSNEKETNALSLMQNFTVEKKFCKGDSFPVSLEAKGGVIQLDPASFGNAKVAHDFFVKANEEDLLFSLDGENWSEFADIFTGSFGFSANIAEDSPVLHGLFVANLRQAS